MVVAVGEVLEVRGTLAPRVDQGERLLDVIGVQELLQGGRHQLGTAPAEDVLPRRVQEREAPLE